LCTYVLYFRILPERWSCRISASLENSMNRQVFHFYNFMCMYVYLWIYTFVYIQMWECIYIDTYISKHLFSNLSYILFYSSITFHVPVFLTGVYGATYIHTHIDLPLLSYKDVIYIEHFYSSSLLDFARSSVGTFRYMSPERLLGIKNICMYVLMIHLRTIVVSTNICTLIICICKCIKYISG
jgi:serine/threonine protein kinase